MFVLDRRGRPLMPCHPARARELLHKGRAAVARYTPFTIRIKDRLLETSEVDGVAVRIDPGSKATGIAVTDDVARRSATTGEVIVLRRGLYAVELLHRGHAVRKSMEQRAGYRRRRRVANTRYRAPRFDNRYRRSGWLPPSLQHRVDTTWSQVERLARLVPLTEIHVERVSFDTHALSAGRELAGAEYQQGTLAGYELRNFLLEKWGRRCAYCGNSGVPLQVEHIQPRASGGSNRVSNLTLSCASCNQTKASRPVGDFLKDSPAVAARLAQQAKAPLRDAAAMNATRYRLADRLHDLERPVSCWSGGRTKYNRVRCRLAKSHTLDALAVGEIKSGCRIVRYPSHVLVATATGRGSYARTRPDRYGFPRLALSRTKAHHGFQTGDLVRAVVPVGKKAGTYVGRVAVRASGRFNIRTQRGVVQGIGHQHVCLLQRADGYGYAIREEVEKAQPPAQGAGVHAGGVR
ncbi:RNA-guided endonuclease IscB [Streptomyces sp. ME02-8801-2C]|uniref:RNA-guided endonuclease IscB n=1 Tax=Streptomyces sp. ME02-8801-2C TaxID=3028680 RepID=UPI0029B53647|nr:RNA-guided endonuclease IscB [Streptomyces sp. ME02-8801-2C]MDX3455438.1 RNA-guided endonuclease IscB [Streptomyces sp. ME02-8801-2C]